MAAIVTSGLSLLAVWLTMRDARARDRLADARNLRDARRQRLRGAIENIVLASLAIGQVVREKSALFSNEAEQQRDERHVKMLQEKWVGLDQARVALMVQGPGKRLIEIADRDIMGAFQQYTTRLSMNAQHPGTVPYAELSTFRDQVEKGIDELIVESQRTLDAMDKPL